MAYHISGNNVLSFTFPLKKIITQNDGMSIDFIYS